LIVRGGRAAFDADPLVVRAAENIVSEIGEATKALPTATTGAISEVPWRALAGMRDRTIHRYPEVDLDVLWDTMEHTWPARFVCISTTLTSDADHVRDVGMREASADVVIYGRRSRSHRTPSADARSSWGDSHVRAGRHRDR